MGSLTTKTTQASAITIGSGPRGREKYVVGPIRIYVVGAIHTYYGQHSR